MAAGLPGSVIVPLQLEQAEAQAGLLDYACRTSRGAVYLQCTGRAATSPPTTATLDYLTHCLEPSAHGMPRCDVFPLLPFLGWTPDQVAALADAEEVIAAAEHAKECHGLLDELNAARQAAGLPSLSLTLTAGHAEAADGSPPPQQAHDEPAAPQQDGQQGPAAAAAEQQAAEPAGPAGPCSRVIGDWPHPHLQFAKVAVGGTFDRLHAGHRLLLAATALVSRQHIFVGITADKLLASKKNRELLETYEEREAAAVGYMKMINPGATVVAGPLTDPQEPPLCAVDPEFDAIVVSEETIPGAHAINKTRAELGFPPLVIVVIGLIYSRRRAAKLSSTDLRAEDASGPGGSPRGSSPARGRGS
ncbi:phosphopantetheine adenylyltransferase-like isoform X1 [Chlorella sorokiniana]|uniref:Phosphopantetheine adenylyltransferase-like isoform X1 n=1 Tax=Chlorella sorokiniana TaxID=3076 RepID=A0A2P6TSW7_CHLSO|nr:phosphopantetheine adenylyltransferase-like isoform X1 [Chlorella sorokiniana]|eukprot:PRW57160.1 phosphopantetheine adenylyltransferase-like isoform X1 [Chlorella sorokiniana]